MAVGFESGDKVYLVLIHLRLDPHAGLASHLRELYICCTYSADLEGISLFMLLVSGNMKIPKPQ